MTTARTQTSVPTFVVGDARLNDHIGNMAMIEVYRIVGCPVKKFELLSVEGRACLCFFEPYGEPEPVAARSRAVVDLDPIMPVLIMPIPTSFTEKAKVYAERMVQWQPSWTYLQQSNWGKTMMTVLEQLDVELNKFKKSLTETEYDFMRHYYWACAANPKIWEPRQ